MENEQLEQEHMKLKLIEFMIKNPTKIEGKNYNEILEMFYEQH